MTDGHDAHEHSLVMPFVVCEDQGGPYHAASFVAGFEAGGFDRALNATKGLPVVIERWVMTPLVPQLDLIAMHHEQTFKRCETDESGEWTRVRAGHPALVQDADDGPDLDATS